MQSAKITRRIDEPGRVVIPKEIRRSLKLNKGEEMEIFVNDEGVVFKKYSRIINYKNIFFEVCDNLEKSVGGMVIIASNDSIVASCDKYSRCLTDKSVCVKLSNKFFDRNVLQNEKTPITIEENINYNIEIVSPIIRGGDVSGGIIVLSDDENNLQIKIKTTEFATNLLGTLIR